MKTILGVIAAAVLGFLCGYGKGSDEAFVKGQVAGLQMAVDALERTINKLTVPTNRKPTLDGGKL